jgi:hypothetical protein
MADGNKSAANPELRRLLNFLQFQLLRLQFGHSSEDKTEQLRMAGCWVTPYSLRLLQTFASNPTS